MRVFVASSVATSTADAVLEIASRLQTLGFARQAKGQSALLFSSQHHAREPDALAEALCDLLGVMPFLGFFGKSAFHEQRIPEAGPGLCVLVLEGVEAEVGFAPLDGFGADVAAQLLADSRTGTARILAVADGAAAPFDFLHALDQSGADILGALSFGAAAHSARILLPGSAEAAAVGMLTWDGPRFVSGVAQAGRALGPARTVTASHANLIQEIDGRPAFEALLQDLPTQLRPQLSRLGGALYAAFDAGDAFVQRHIVGLDPRTGAVALAGPAPAGTDIFFTLRDRTTARTDLEEMLAALEAALARVRPKAFLVFSSSARDEGFLGTALWDVTRVLSRFGPDVPVVGCSGSGEIATVGASTHIFNQSVAVAAIV